MELRCDNAANGIGRCIVACDVLPAYRLRQLGQLSFDVAVLIIPINLRVAPCTSKR